MLTWVKWKFGLGKPAPKTEKPLEYMTEGELEALSAKLDLTRGEIQEQRRTLARLIEQKHLENRRG